MNETVGWIDRAWHALDQFLSFPGPLRAMILGLLISWLGSQWLKFLPTVLSLGATEHRVFVRLLAFVLAYVPTLILWPAHFAERQLLALVTGMVAPTAYKLVVLFAYHKWPWLEQKLSAKPQGGAQ